jgi:hypothetical protein
VAPRFDTPVRIEALANPGPDDDPSLTADGLELYFSSNRAGTEDIWVSLRESRETPWSEPIQVVELSSSFIDATPGISPDGLTIWFESTRQSQSLDLLDTDIWTAERPTRSSPWSAPVLVSELSTDRRESNPQPSSLLLMTFSAWYDPGVGDTDIYVTVRAQASAPWGPPMLLAEASSDSWDQALLRADGTQLFISSGRQVSLAGGNLFWSARPALNAPFPEPELLELSSDSDDQDLWVAPELDYAVFASDRDGDLDLYEAHAVP